MACTLLGWNKLERILGARDAKVPQMNTNPTEGAVARNSGTQRQEPAPSTYGELADLLEQLIGG